METNHELTQKIENLKEQISVLTTKSIELTKKAQDILQIDSSLTYVAKRLHKAAKHLSICALNCELKINQLTKQIAKNSRN